MKDLKIWYFHSYQLNITNVEKMKENLAVRLKDLGYDPQFITWSNQIDKFDNAVKMRESDLGIFIHYNTPKIAKSYIGAGIHNTIQSLKKNNIPVLTSFHSHSKDIVGTLYNNVNTTELDDSVIDKNFKTKFAKLEITNKLFNDNQIIDLLNK